MTSSQHSHHHYYYHHYHHYYDEKQKQQQQQQLLKTSSTKKLANNSIFNSHRKSSSFKATKTTTSSGGSSIDEDFDCGGRGSSSESSYLKRLKCALDYEMDHVLTVLNDSLGQLDRASRGCHLWQNYPNKLTYKRSLNNTNRRIESTSTLSTTSTTTPEISSQTSLNPPKYVKIKKRYYFFCQAKFSSCTCKVIKIQSLGLF